MTNTVLIKRSAVANAVPGPSSLLAGELAINYADGNLFYKNSGNTVTVIASNKFSSVTGNVTANNGMFTNIVNVASYTGTLVSVTGNITGGNILTPGIVSTAGNIYLGAANTRTYVYAASDGAGAQAGQRLTFVTTGLTGNATIIEARSNSASNVGGTGFAAFSTLPGSLSTYNFFAVSAGLGYIETSGNAFSLTIAGTANSAIFSNISANFAGAVSAAGNITAGNATIGTSVNSVFDQVAAVRPLVVQASNASTTLNGSSAAMAIVNSDITTNNSAQLNFAAITGASANQYSAAIISTIFGPRTNAQYPTGTLTFSTSSALNLAPTEKMRIAASGNVGIANTAPTTTLGVTGTAYVSGNVTSGNISAIGNVTANNGIFTNIVNVASYTGTLVSVTGNVTANNGIFTNIVNVASYTGTLVSVTGNVTANNGMFTNIVNVASHTGAVVSVTGNVIAGGGIVTRVVSIADATSVTINAATTDLATQTNTQAAGTLTINAPTGTLANGQKFIFRLQSSNIQTFSWNAVFVGSTDLSLPTVSSGSSKYDYMGFIYNSTAAEWQILAKNFGF